MLQFEIDAEVRAATGKGAMRRLRTQGLTPAIVYGAGAQALPLQINTKELMANLLEFYRKNTVVTLKVSDGSKKHVVVAEVQTDPVADTLIHADFCEIDLNKMRKYKVPVRYTGTPKGVDLGGDLQTFETSIFLEGKPLDIPDECVLDITNLNIGDEYTFSAFEIPASLKMLSAADDVCVKVVKLSK